MSRDWNDPFRKNPDPKAVVARHRSTLLAGTGVVSVGLGFGPGHRTVIVVGVTSEEDAATAALPSELDGVPVEVRVVGELTAGDTEE
jgi:hypothetical protein